MNLASLQLMAFDIDGVMTDGRLWYSPRGDEMKAFFVRDGLGLKLLMEAGVQVAIITGRDSLIVSERARDLGIAHVRQGVRDKRVVMAELLAGLGLTFEQAGYMGDDIVDLTVMTACAFSATVPDGHPLVKERAHHVTEASAGAGAVREICELILKARRSWDRLVSDIS